MLHRGIVQLYVLIKFLVRLDWFLHFFFCVPCRHRRLFLHSYGFTFSPNMHIQNSKMQQKHCKCTLYTCTLHTHINYLSIREIIALRLILCRAQNWYQKYMTLMIAKMIIMVFSNWCCMFTHAAVFHEYRFIVAVAVAVTQRRQVQVV